MASTLDPSSDVANVSGTNVNNLRRMGDIDTNYNGAPETRAIFNAVTAFNLPGRGLADRSLADLTNPEIRRILDFDLRILRNSQSLLGATTGFNPFNFDFGDYIYDYPFGPAFGTPADYYTGYPVENIYNLPQHPNRSHYTDPNISQHAYVNSCSSCSSCPSGPKYNQFSLFPAEYRNLGPQYRPWLSNPNQPWNYYANN